MGTSNRGPGTIGNLEALEQSRSAMQQTIDNEKDISERRRLGQFSTPYELAKEMVSYGLSVLDAGEITFLEPCIGSGAFYSALLNTVHSVDAIKCAAGIEIDPAYCACAQKLWGDRGIHILNDNFTRAVPDKRYHFLLTNLQMSVSKLSFSHCHS